MMNKIVDFLRTQYRNYPYLFVFVIALILTVPWVFMGGFYTKGEPREATVAVDILKNSDWILPAGYADEFAYKPPFMHWFIALFSLITGSVSEATTRLPSSVGLIGITMAFFAFLYRRKDSFFAVVAALIMLTSFEMHRSGIEGRVDMFLTFFSVLALLAFFQWEEKNLRGYPVLLPVFMACAALIKGPVGIVLPCLVFSVYLLLLRRYSLFQIIIKNVIVALPALAIASVWYYFAYLRGGDHFLKLVYAENFGRFLGQDKAALGISYDLGHKGPFWYYIPAVFLGFLPWSLVVVFALFSISYRKLNERIRSLFPHTLQRIAQMDKITLFSVVSVVVITGFYAIPSSKRSVYVMSAYPFAAYLLAVFYEWLASGKRIWTIRLLHRILAVLASLIAVVTVLFCVVDMTQVVGFFSKQKKLINDLGLYSTFFAHVPAYVVVMLCLLLLAVAVSCFVVKRLPMRTQIAGLIGLMIVVQLFLEAVYFPVFKNGYSIRPFASEIMKDYSFRNNVYVMNDLNRYHNMYGLNFYMGHQFRNFEKEKPAAGYFLCGKADFEKVKEIYQKNYTFTELKRTPYPYNDYGDVIILFSIQQK